MRLLNTLRETTEYGIISIVFKKERLWQNTAAGTAPTSSALAKRS